MGSRMDRYKDTDNIPSRSDKNKALYTQVYNAYDEFENLVVPSNAKEITISDLRNEIINEVEETSKEDTVEVAHEIHETRVNDEIDEYDINELINKAVSKNEDDDSEKVESLTNGSYLKKLKLDNRKTNIEQVKEMWEDIQDDEDEDYEDESLIKTANLSLEILSDLKSDNEDGEISKPVQSEDDEITEGDNSFYSGDFRFSKKDFDDADETDDDSEEEEEESDTVPTDSVDEEEQEEDTDEEDDEEDDDDYEEESNGKFFLKILLLIFGILLVIGLVVYFIVYFDRV